MFSLEKRGFEDDSGDSQDDSLKCFWGARQRKTMISPGAAPAGMDMHGRAGKPKELRRNAKKPGETFGFWAERTGTELVGVFPVLCVSS